VNPNKQTRNAPITSIRPSGLKFTGVHKNPDWKMISHLIKWEIRVKISNSKKECQFHNIFIF